MKASKRLFENTLPRAGGSDADHRFATVPSAGEGSSLLNLASNGNAALPDRSSRPSRIEGEVGFRAVSKTDFAEGNLVDLQSKQIYPAKVTWCDGIITAIERLEAPSDLTCDRFLMPGFIDSHIHIESSMLVPSQFARIAVTHGTVATVSDPHEIANVLGVRGVQFMLDDADRVPMKFCFGAPSCVPATPFETAGGSIGIRETEQLLDQDDIHYLAEMMNYPGVIGGDQSILAKIDAAKIRGLPIDGHAPAVRGEDAGKYFAAGISTDHECFTEAEAIEKLELGVTIQIREGSAARNFDALHRLIDRYPGRIMLCSDDKHPDELIIDHINGLCRRAIAAGCDFFNTLTAACVTPVAHYGMRVGLLQVGDPADFIEVESLETFQVTKTWIDGECVFANQRSNIQVDPPEPINHFCVREKAIDDFQVTPIANKRIRVIEAHDGLLTTTGATALPRVVEKNVVSCPQSDVLKLTVVNRYADSTPAIGFVSGFGMTEGAIAGSVGHDSHNILAVGVSDQAIASAVNMVIKSGGGLSCVNEEASETLSLPVAGLMSIDSAEDVAAKYLQLDGMAKNQGCQLQSPYMTLSFLALLVIPSLKLSDKGLFSGERFELVDLFVDE